MSKNIKIFSLSEKLELANDAIKYASKNWFPISKYFADIVNQVAESKDKLPQCFLLMKKDKIIGFYALLKQDLIERKDLMPWISLVFVDEKERGQNIVKEILLHGRKMAGKMGFKKVYLSSNLIHLYEKYGFKEIALDMFVWGKPTKIYENTTIIEKKGNVIFLNGVSSAGKTTLSFALQEKLDEPYFIIAQDMFRQMWGRKYWEDSPGNIYNMTMSLMYKTIKLFSDEGKNVIVDHLIFDDKFLNSFNDEGTLKDVVNLLYEYPVIFVHVTCDVEELRRREKERGDRELGHAEKQLSHLMPRDTYDLIIDTHKNPMEESVEKIIETLNTINEMTALKKLKSTLNI